MATRTDCDASPAPQVPPHCCVCMRVANEVPRHRLCPPAAPQETLVPWGSGPGVWSKQWCLVRKRLWGLVCAPRGTSRAGVCSCLSRPSPSSSQSVLVPRGASAETQGCLAKPQRFTKCPDPPACPDCGRPPSSAGPCLWHPAAPTLAGATRSALDDPSGAAGESCRDIGHAWAGASRSGGLGSRGHTPVLEWPLIQAEALFWCRAHMSSTPHPVLSCCFL